MRNNSFTCIAGNPTAKDEEMNRRIDAGEQLVDLQIEMHRRGFRSAKLTKSMYGWSVRAGSGLDNFELLYRAQNGDGSIEAAIAWGVAWAKRDPEHREFFALADDLQGVDLSRFR